MVAKWFKSSTMFKHSWRLKTQVQIPARDYNIDCSEVEILCRYSNLHTYNCYPIKANYSKRWSILDTATYQSPAKSYRAGLRQVSEATSPLSQSNHREKSQRKAEKKKKSSNHFNSRVEIHQDFIALVFDWLLSKERLLELWW